MSITKKRGSIALARSLCYQINGAADDSNDSNGGGYGSVDIAEILSAEVLRLREALAQRTWVGLTEEERKDIALEVPIEAVLITEAKLKQKNNV
jgi:hypothetical protein